MSRIVVWSSLLALCTLAALPACEKANADSGDDVASRVQALETQLQALQTKTAALESTVDALTVDLGLALVKNASTDPAQVAVAMCEDGGFVVTGGCACSAGATLEWSRPYMQSDCQEWGCVLGWECSCVNGTENVYALCAPAEIPVGAPE